MAQPASLRLVVGSKNPVKVAAAKETLTLYFPEHDIECIALDAPSDVSPQPLGEPETLLGAQNRVAFCKRHEQADFYMAMEGGAARFDYGAATFAYVVIAHAGQTSVGRSNNLPLPNALYHQLTQGEELGDVMDAAFNTHNIKQRGGAIGLLTQGHATRQSTYQNALTLAMAPFIHPQLFTEA